MNVLSMLRLFGIAFLALALSPTLPIEIARAQQINEPFTILIASDPQLPWWRAARDPDCSSEECVKMRAEETNADQVLALDNIASVKWISGHTRGIWPDVPQLTIGAGSAVQSPIGVIVNGDLTAFWHGWQVDMYRKYFDPGYSGAAPEVLRSTIFPGLGNHDYANNVGDCGWPDRNACAKDAVRYIKKMVNEGTVRNFGSQYLTSFDEGSLAYAFDIGNHHFVQLHNYPTYERPEIGISKSIGWLTDNLAAATAAGKRIVINMHDYGEHMPTNDPEFLAAINGQNVIAVFAGHIHEDHGYIGNVPTTTIPYFRSGASEYGTFLLVEFGADYFNAGVVESTRWLGQERIVDVSTTDGIGAAFNKADNRTYAIWNGYHNDGIYYSSYNNTSWSPQGKIANASTKTRPAIAYFEPQSRLYAAWNGYHDDGIFYAHYENGQWSGQQKIAGVGTKTSPALAQYGGRLYAAWNGYNNDGVFFASFDGSSWSGQARIPGVGTQTGPALATFGGKLYAAWNGYHNDGIYYAHYENGRWSGQQKIAGVATKTSPALTVYDEKLWAIWNGYHDDGLFYATFDGSGWSPQGRLGRAGTKTTPAIATNGVDELVAVWNGYHNDGIYFSTFQDGTKFYEPANDKQLLNTYQ